MLYLFGFRKVGVAVSDLFFVDPEPGPGQEGAEHGVRLEVRVLDQPEIDGSIYASRPIVVDRPIWRADLLESLSGEPGSHDRTHHHPSMRGWEPGSRQYDRAMSDAPVEWVGRRLSDLPKLLEEAEVDPGMVDPEDAEELRRAVPEILDAVNRLLAAVREGSAAVPPPEPVAAARTGWL